MMRHINIFWNENFLTQQKTFLKVLIGSIDLFPKKIFLDFLFAFLSFTTFFEETFLIK